MTNAGLLCGFLWVGTIVAADDPLTLAGVREFTAAYTAWDGAQMATAAALLGQGQPSATNEYWRGVVEFHRLLFLLGEPARATNRAVTTQALTTAIATLLRAAQYNPANGECRALLSTTYGLSIMVNPTRALWLGPRLLEQEKQARQLSPTNPRVLYLAGLNRFYGPGLLGGKNEALKLLTEAERLFATEAAQPGEPLMPRWGHNTCLVYLGKTHAALGQPAEARKCFERALSINPRDRLAASELARTVRVPGESSTAGH